MCKKTILELGNDHYCGRNASVVFGFFCFFSAVGYFLCSVALWDAEGWLTKSYTENSGLKAGTWRSMTQLTFNRLKCCYAVRRLTFASLFTFKNVDCGSLKTCSELQMKKLKEAALFFLSLSHVWCFWCESLCRSTSTSSVFFLPFLSQAENETLRSAVYVNVAQLRKSISESPPSAPSSYSPSYLDQEGWEVHVDDESGKEYYYHPTTGRTTWDNPFLDSPEDPEPVSPSPPLTPARSPSPVSPTPAWTSDWEQLVDESSGRPYFYNAMSGETSWEPPEQLSPYPPLMEPMSVHRFHEDGPVRTAWLLHLASLSPVIASPRGKL